MIKILADASLPDLSFFFQDPFQITRFRSALDLPQLIQGHDVLLCRSTLKVNAALLAHTQIQCVATVSSGTDHISELDTLPQSIPILDAKGANACAVADYVVASVAYCQRQGYVQGHHVGVIGSGAVGSEVTRRLRKLGFNVISYDPLLAERDPHFSHCEFEALLACDLLCVHANLHDDLPNASRHLLDARFLSQLSPGTVIINAARGDIVDETALLACAQSLYYCTDVYSFEPFVNEAVVTYATLCTPHIAGHSIEARNKALYIVSQKIYQHFGMTIPTKLGATPEILLDAAQDATWQAVILSLYDPMLETCILKQAADLTTAFLESRKAHHQRHDFNCYTQPNMSVELKAALGLTA